jgi:hypothetical protein
MKRTFPHVMAFETMTGTSAAVVDWGFHASLGVGSGAVAQTAAADDPEGEADGAADGAGEPHAAAAKASASRNERTRRGDIRDSVSKSVGTCRRGRMAAS